MALKPPMKSMPSSSAALSRVRAISTICSDENGAATTPIGLMDIRLLATSMPYRRSMRVQVSTSLPA